MEKCLIVAMASDGAIGVKGALPWHISEDLKFFKATTLSFPVIMGRTTFESIGRPLPRRRNIVLSRRGASIEGVEMASSLEEALSLCEGSQKVFVIGGASVYKEAMPLMDRLYITEVHTEVADADAFFPQIDPSLFKEVSRSEMKTDPETGLRFEFVEYLNSKFLLH